MTLKGFKEILIKHYHTTKQKNCIGSVEKVVEELFTGIDDDFLITSICQQEIDDACKKNIAGKYFLIGVGVGSNHKDIEKYRIEGLSALPSIFNKIWDYEENNPIIQQEIDDKLNLQVSETSSEFLCKCGKMKGWITENQITQPCPNCGRKYKGKYSKKDLTIIGIEI